MKTDELISLIEPLLDIKTSPTTVTTTEQQGEGATKTERVLEKQSKRKNTQKKVKKPTVKRKIKTDENSNKKKAKFENKKVTSENFI